MDLGRCGIWEPRLGTSDPVEAAAAIAELDDTGWGTIWVPGGHDVDAFRGAERVLRCSHRTKVAIGDVDIAVHPPGSVLRHHRELQNRHGNRLLLGLLSRDPRPAPQAGNPVAKMNCYLDALDRMRPATVAEETLLTAPDTPLIDLARRRALGVRRRSITPDQTAWTRAFLGDGPMLVVQQTVLLESERPVEDGVRLGLTGGDVAVVRGGVEAIKKHVHQHIDAGADHVCLHVLSQGSGLPRAAWRQLSAVATHGRLARSVTS